MGRREGPSEERRQAILHAAEEVFTEQGYHGASIRAIAGRAGVSSALLYWFFPSKADLFAAIVTARADAQGVFDFPEAVFAIPPEELLPRLAHGLLGMMGNGEQIRLMKLALRDSDRSPEVTAVMAKLITSRLLGPLAEYFRRQTAAGRLRPANPDYVAQAFAGILMLLILRREIMQEPESRTWDLDDYADTAVRIFLLGALPDPAGAHPAPPEPATRPVPRSAIQRIPIEE